MKIMHWLFLLGLWACGGKTHTNSPVPLIIVDSNFLEKQAKAMDTVALVHTKKETPRDCSDSSLYKSVMGEMIMSLTTAQDSIFGRQMWNSLLDERVIIGDGNHLKELVLCGKTCYAILHRKYAAEIDTSKMLNGSFIVNQILTGEDCNVDGDGDLIQTISAFIYPAKDVYEWVVVLSFLRYGEDGFERITAWKWNEKTKKWKHFHQCLPDKMPKDLLFSEKQTKEVYLMIDEDGYGGLKGSINNEYFNFYFEENDLKICPDEYDLIYDDGVFREDIYLFKGNTYSLYYRWDKLKNQFVYYKRELNK